MARSSGSKAFRQAALPAVVLLAAPAALVATNPAGARAALAAIADPLAVLTARSPGERGPGALTQSKARLAAAHHPRSERVLPFGRLPVAPGLAPPADYVPADLVGPTDLVPGGEIPLTPVDFPVAGGGGGGGVGPFIGGGYAIPPGGGGKTSTTPVTPTPPATASVPEPATWLTTLLGCLVVGVALRRRPAARLVRGQG